MTALPYRALWRRELNAGLYGQHPALTATWKRDHLWLAAVYQHQAEETERMLRDAMDAHDHPDVIRHFLVQYEADCARCHRIFLDGEQGVTHAAA